MHKLKEGGANDWQGVLGQKIPRFDNRIINDCALLNGLQVCNVTIKYDAKSKRPHPDSLLASEVTFLMKLKNTLVSGTDGQRKLTPDEIQTIFKAATADALAVAPDAKDWARKVAERYALTKTAWGSKKGIKQLELRPLTGHEIVKSPKTEGRSRFSRPALRLIRALILSGQKPSEFRRRLLAHEQALLDEIGMDVRDTEPTRDVNGAKTFIKQSRPWILTSHLKFLEDLGRVSDTWEGFHIPEQRLDALEARHTDDDGDMDKQAAIRELLGNINDPVVRHRLGIFAHRLEELHKTHGVPTEIVLEFVREDFMGEQALRDLQKFQSDREKSRKEAKEKAAELGAGEKSASLKYELCKTQGCICLYCGQTFAATELADYEIEHIVPRSQGGPDAMVNYVLAHKDCNDKKGEQTPFQWKHGKEGWNGYETIVKQHAVALRNKKVQLLLREDAPELVQRYTALAETAWISKLAQTIISLHFGWRNGIDYSEKNPVKRVTVISGGLTGRIRRKYRLYSLLNPPPPGTTDLNEWEASAEKNRADDRHHALDAMVISFLPTWARDARKEHFFRFPDSIHKNAKAFFEKAIEDVRPKYIARLKPALEETFYGARNIFGEAFIVKRRPLADLATKEVKGKLEIKPSKDIKPQKIVDGAIRRLVEGFLESHPQPSLNEWLDWCKGVRLGKNGPHVEKVLMTETEPNALEEYGNFSKSGQSSRGQYRRAATHAGYFIITRPAPTKSQPDYRKIEVRPVFAFQSRKAISEKLREEPGLEIVDYFYSNCQVTIARPWEFKSETFPPGEYMLKTVWAQGNAVLKHAKHGLLGAKPKHNAPIGIRILVEAGMRRVD